MPPRKTTTRKKEPPKQPREVVRVIDSREIVLAWAAAENGGHVEVREHRNGTWTIHYPEAGWIGCFPDCSKRHTHETVRPLTQVNADFLSPEEAYEIAQDYAGTREVKILPLEKPSRPGGGGTPFPIQHLVACSMCSKEVDAGIAGASFTITPYDKRRTKLKQEGYLCNECVDELPGKPK